MLLNKKKPRKPKKIKNKSKIDMLIVSELYKKTDISFGIVVRPIFLNLVIALCIRMWSFSLYPVFCKSTVI